MLIASCVVSVPSKEVYSIAVIFMSQEVTELNENFLQVRKLMRSQTISTF